MNIKIDVTKTYFITGAAGFIGSSLAKKLLSQGCKVIGIDNINDYYDQNLKLARLQQLKNHQSFVFIKGDIADKELILSLFKKYQPQIVINLAAQAGVRYSIDNPDAYIHSNILGFFNILEACRYNPVQHLIYASSSSVYGANKKVPFAETDFVDNPVSLYAATKKSNELMAHTYSHLYHIPVTGLRFFTVYGPMGRPDMAYFKFTNKLVKKEKIQIYNYGKMYRDFTYIDDIIEGVLKIIAKEPKVNANGLKYNIYNIGNNAPVSLKDFVEILEAKLLKYHIISDKVEKELLPMQDGDVYQTYANVEKLMHDFDFKPTTSLDQGLDNFAKWYADYYLTK